jgi:hypothetical protein
MLQSLGRPIATAKQMKTTIQVKDGELTITQCREGVGDSVVRLPAEHYQTIAGVITFAGSVTDAGRASYGYGHTFDSEKPSMPPVDSPVLKGLADHAKRSTHPGPETTDRETQSTQAEPRQ